MTRTASAHLRSQERMSPIQPSPAPAAWLSTRNQGRTKVSSPSSLQHWKSAYLCIGVATWNLPSTADNSGVQPLLTEANSRISGAEFTVGVTTVQYTVTDGSGNTKSCSFTVTVQDDNDPEITCPGNVVVSTSGATQAASWSPATATDNADTSVALSYTKASGSSFAVGSTTTVSP